jgi:hypothetical protein
MSDEGKRKAVIRVFDAARKKTKEEFFRSRGIKTVSK